VPLRRRIASDLSDCPRPETRASVAATPPGLLLPLLERVEARGDRLTRLAHFLLRSRTPWKPWVRFRSSALSLSASMRSDLNPPPSSGSRRGRLQGERLLQACRSARRSRRQLLASSRLRQLRLVRRWLFETASVVREGPRTGTSRSSALTRPCSSLTTFWLR